MDAERLMERLKDYGADMRGIHERFMDDIALYEECYHDFFDDVNFVKLKQAMTSGDYEAAFGFAHALKGLSGNLGLMPFYDVLVKLVESLRAKDYRLVNEQYADVLIELQRLAALTAENTLNTAEAPAQTAPVMPETETPVSPPDGSAWFTRTVVIAILLTALPAILMTVFVAIGSDRRPDDALLWILGFITLAAPTAFLLLRLRRVRAFGVALTERERALDLIAESTGNAFMLFSVGRGKPIYRSRNLGSVTGISDFVLVKARPGFKLTLPDTTNALYKPVNDRLASWDGRSELICEPVMFTRDGRAVYILLSFHPVRGSTDETVVVAQDITQTRQREETVKTALAMAERSNAAKNRFLANMSHDIRTPMNAIMNMTDFALESFDQPVKQREYLQIVRKTSDHLLSLVNEVLDMSRIESGQTLIDSEPFNVRDMLEKVCDIVRPLCAAKRQTFITDFESIHTVNVLGDHVKLSQIFINLLLNANRFTPDKGAIRFTAVEVPALRDGLVDMQFVVEDNGVGISREDQKRIFEPFTRLNGDCIGDNEGSGLGLSICKSYVTAMGGHIQCESEPDNGSIFSVELFFGRVTDKRSQSAAHGETGHNEVPFLGKRCLLCEDNDINQRIAQTILEKIGFIVDVAENGLVGAHRFIASRPSYYDVIYMDIFMPKMDGYQATVAIRESHHPQASVIPIIALTANVFAEDVEKARLAGMNGFVGKPITVLALIDETRRLLNGGEV